MNLFNLFAKLTLDDSEYKKGLKDSEQSASTFSQKAAKAFKAATAAIAAVTGAAVAAATAITKLVTSTTSYLDDIDNASKQLQITTTQYQEWDWIMKQIGADSSTLEAAFRQIATVTGNIADGNVDAILSLRNLGIEYKDFMKMDPSAQFDTLISAFQGLEAGTKKTQLAQEIFGNRVYQKLMPILNDAEGSVEELKDEINSLGLIMSEKVVQDGQKLNDELLFTKGMIKQLVYSFGVELLPQVKDINKAFRDIAQGKDIEESVQTIGDAINEIVLKTIDKIKDIARSGVLEEIAKAIGNAIVNGFLYGFEKSLNLTIDMINLFTKGISYLWTWLGIPKIPEIPHVEIPTVALFENGGLLEEMTGLKSGTMYAVAGEKGAEIVASGSRGTGVANVEQIEQAMYNALRRIFGTDVTLRIGDRDFRAYINQAQNSTLKSQGRKTLNSVTRY